MARRKKKSLWFKSKKAWLWLWRQLQLLGLNTTPTASNYYFVYYPYRYHYHYHHRCTVSLGVHHSTTAACVRHPSSGTFKTAALEAARQHRACSWGTCPTKGLDLAVLIEPSHAGLTAPAVLVRVGQVHLQSGIAQDDPRWPGTAREVANFLEPLFPHIIG